MNHSAVPLEHRAMTRAVPRAVRIVPGDGAALVSAACRKGVERALIVAPDGNLLLSLIDDPALTTSNLRDVSDLGLAIAILMEAIGSRSRRIVKRTPRAGSGDDLGRDREARSGPVADAPAVEAGRHIKTGRA